MSRISRTIRAVIVVVVLATSLSLLSYFGLPYQPLEATAARLNTVLYDEPAKIWLPMIRRNR